MARDREVSALGNVWRAPAARVDEVRVVARDGGAIARVGEPIAFDEAAIAPVCGAIALYGAAIAFVRRPDARRGERIAHAVGPCGFDRVPGVHDKDG